MKSEKYTPMSKRQKRILLEEFGIELPDDTTQHAATKAINAALNARNKSRRTDLPERAGEEHEATKADSETQE